MKRRTWIKATLIALTLAVCSSAALAMGEETFGNAPLSAANYKDWPGILPVINHTSRVYHTWVNDNEHFYYRGDTATLNDTLEKFAEAKSEVREVVLRPGPGMTVAFDGKKQIPFGWNLHLVGGIARHLTTLKQGSKVWSPHPVLTIYAGGDLDLRRLKIPKGLTVSSLADVKQRTREGLKSEDKTVRGWTCGVLAELDSYDAESLKAIAGLLSDEDSWVQLNAATSLASFGKKAQVALPQLRVLAETGDAQLKEGAQKSMQTIAQAQDRSAAEREYRQTLNQIQRFMTQKKQSTK
jgi:hypothetical protein